MYLSLESYFYFKSLKARVFSHIVVDSLIDLQPQFKRKRLQGIKYLHQKLKCDRNIYRCICSKIFRENLYQKSSLQPGKPWEVSDLLWLMASSLKIHLSWLKFKSHSKIASSHVSEAPYVFAQSIAVY